MGGGVIRGNTFRGASAVEPSTNWRADARIPGFTDPNYQQWVAEWISTNIHSGGAGRDVRVHTVERGRAELGRADSGPVASTSETSTPEGNNPPLGGETTDPTPNTSGGAINGRGVACSRKDMSVGSRQHRTRKRTSRLAAMESNVPSGESGRRTAVSTVVRRSDLNATTTVLPDRVGDEHSYAATARSDSPDRTSGLSYVPSSGDNTTQESQHDVEQSAPDGAHTGATRVNKRTRWFVVSNGSVFNADGPIAHAVGADMHMGAGVARDLCQMYPDLAKYRRKPQVVGTSFRAVCNGRVIYNMVTKPLSSVPARASKDAYKDFQQALDNCLEQVEGGVLNVPYLPGAGLDKLHEGKIRHMMTVSGKRHNVRIIAWSLSHGQEDDEYVAPVDQQVFDQPIADPPEGQRHQHRCVKCDEVYEHYHMFKQSNHAQFAYQCPNENCPWWHKGHNPTRAKLLDDPEEFKEPVVAKETPVQSNVASVAAQGASVVPDCVKITKIGTPKSVKLWRLIVGAWEWARAYTTMFMLLSFVTGMTASDMYDWVNLTLGFWGVHAFVLLNVAYAYGRLRFKWSKRRWPEPIEGYEYMELTNKQLKSVAADLVDELSWVVYGTYRTPGTIMNLKGQARSWLRKNYPKMASADARLVLEHALPLVIPVTKAEDLLLTKLAESKSDLFRIFNWVTKGTLPGIRRWWQWRAADVEVPYK